jgi:hypothetical protein
MRHAFLFIIIIILVGRREERKKKQIPNRNQAKKNRRGMA